MQIPGNQYCYAAVHVLLFVVLCVDEEMDWLITSHFPYIPCSGGLETIESLTPEQ